MRTVGALVFPGFELLDLFGPMEMFGLLPDEFELKLVAESKGAVLSNQQLLVNVDASIGEQSDFDILLYRVVLVLAKKSTTQRCLTGSTGHLKKRNTR